MKRRDVRRGRRATRSVVAVLAASAVAATGATAASRQTDGGPTVVELYFELKLLYRGGVAVRAAVDEWAGGRLRMSRVGGHPGGDGTTTLSLECPLEDPWTFRWYPTRHEVKLGAAVWVPRPRGDAYAALAAALAVAARERYRLWWEDDRVRSTAPETPSWAASADRFWAQRHRRELEIKDPLSDPPVYPFHVLGDARGRFVVPLDGGGVVLSSRIEQRMSEPWLPGGWQAWLDGQRPSGYGYWERKRPSWEPGTYRAVAAAVALLGWSPWNHGSPSPASATDGARRYRVPRAAPAATDASTSVDLLRQVGRVVTALLPRAAERLPWSGSPPVDFRVGDDGDRWTVTRGQSPPTPAESDSRVVQRVWRYSRFDRRAGVVEQDELQLLVTVGNGDDVKLWLEVGFRPTDERCPLASSGRAGSFPDDDATGVRPSRGRRSPADATPSPAAASPRFP